jgi:hypothetical protein
VSNDILPELRPYLESILDEALARRGMTMHNAHRRERVISWLHKQFEHFMMYRLLMAMPLAARQHFAFLIEQNASDEELKAFARRHIQDIPVLVGQVFVDFRQRFVQPVQKHRP